MPESKFIETGPDYAGLSDIADFFGFTRQNMRKLMLSHRTTFPPAIHECSVAIWHLADVLDWFQHHQKRRVERSASFSRVPIGRGILRLMERSPTSYVDERNFRELMKVVNLQGGGIVFEKLSECAIDEFMDVCLETALEISGKA
jgi:hypothetical protein